MYKNYIFDQGDIILDIDAGLSLNAFQKLLPPSSKPLPISVADLMGGSEGRLVCEYQVGNISTSEFLHSLKSVVRQDVTEAQILDAWNAMILDIPSERLDALLELRRRGARVFMLSNTNDGHTTHIINKCFAGSRNNMLRYFDDLFLSHEMHLAKPDSEIYSETIRRAGIDPSATIYFDDLPQNIEAGNRAGFHSVLTKGSAWLSLFDL